MNICFRPRAYLVGTYGDDELVAQAAWISIDRTVTDSKRERLAKFLQDLAEQGHHTPFEHSTLHFVVDCDVATHIHLLKHRVGVSVNSESARYKELKDDRLLIPADWPTEWKERLQEYCSQGMKLYHQAVADLTPIVGRKRAKETARYFRTYNTRIQSDVILNWRSFAHMLKLRGSEHAQKEVAILVADMLQQVANTGKFNKTIAALQTAGLIDREYLSTFEEVLNGDVGIV